MTIMKTPFEHEPKSADRDVQQNSLERKVQLLRQKLTGFSVINQKQQILGVVKDLRLDSHRQPTLVIAQPGNNIDQFIEFNTRSISHVNAKARVILIQEIGSPSNVVESSPSPIDLTADGHSEVDQLDGERQFWVEPNSPEVREEMTIPLLEERLKVDYKRRKVGEVIVRKAIETRMIEVPVRYERLIVEQISPERKQLAEVRLDAETLLNSQQVPEVMDKPIVSGEFASPQVASQVLYAIAQNLKSPCRRVRVEIELEDDSFTDLCQQWMNVRTE